MVAHTARKLVINLLPITASIASDLQPLSSSNVILKYADDTYLIIPASSQSTCQLEMQNIERWADKIT